MKIYNPKKWIGFASLYSKTDTVRLLWPYILLVILYCWLIAYIEIEVLQLSNNSWVKNIPVLHNTLGFVISLLLVFRTNTAYDRWWEGRKLWGDLVNTSRNLAIKLAHIIPEENKEERAFFRNIIPLYAKTLKEHLQLEKTRLSLGDASEFEIDDSKHLPNQIASLLIGKLYEMQKAGIITIDHLKLFNLEISKLTEICGGCERIKNTPIPFSYSNFIKRFIVIYIITLPFGYVFQLGYYVAPLVAFVFYVLGSLELIAEEIEDPFGTDDNDLPTDKIAENIKKHIEELI